MKLSFREKVLLLSLVVLGVGYVFYTFLYSPLQTQKDVIAQKNRQLNAQVEILAGRARQNSGIDRETQEQKFRSGFQEQVIKVPGEILLPEAVLYLRKSAKASNVTLTSLILTPDTPNAAKPTGANSPASASEIKITMTAKGGYSGLRAFLLSIHKAPRLYRMDTVKLQSNYQQGSTPPPASPAPPTEGEEAVQPIPIPTIKNEITMNVTMVTFYQEFNAPGFEDRQEKVQPGKGQDNPFTI